MGRHIKLTGELIKKMGKYTEIGIYISTICRCFGIGRTTYYRWIKRGRRDEEMERDSLFLEFWNTIKRAEAKAELDILATVMAEAYRGNWKVAMWFLERRFPERWARKVTKRFNILDYNDPRTGKKIRYY